MGHHPLATEEACKVTGGIVCEATGYAVIFEFGRVGLGEHFVAGGGGFEYLADYFVVCDADDEAGFLDAVAGGVLAEEFAAFGVAGFAFATAALFDLEAGVV